MLIMSVFHFLFVSDLWTIIGPKEQDNVPYSMVLSSPLVAVSLV